MNYFVKNLETNLLKDDTDKHEERDDDADDDGSGGGRVMKWQEG